MRSPQSSLRFEMAGLDRKNWSSAGRIRIMFKQAFVLPYFNNPSFRKTLALLGGQRCRTPEEYKAWSQNLGHEHVLTTFCSYGDVSCYRQSEIIHLPVAALVLRLKIGRSAALVGTEFTPKESRGKTLQGT